VKTDQAAVTVAAAVVVVVTEGAADAMEVVVAIRAAEGIESHEDIAIR
jgi:hypothetical protein